MLTETKELIVLLASVVKAGQGAAADGKVDLTDLGQLMIVFPAIGPAIDNIEDVLPELEALNEESEAELLEYIDVQLGEGAWETRGEDILKAAVHLLRAIKP